MSREGTLGQWFTKHSRMLYGIGIILVMVGFTMVTTTTIQRGRQLERAEAKAKKFDDYCMFVRVSLETTLRTLKRDDKDDPDHTKRYRQHVASSFYAELPQLDREAVARCAVPEISVVDMFKIRNRCKTQADPSCLVPVIEELLNLLAADEKRVRE